MSISIWAKGCMLMIMCVIRDDMTAPPWWREKVVVYYYYYYRLVVPRCARREVSGLILAV